MATIDEGRKTPKFVVHYVPKYEHLESYPDAISLTVPDDSLTVKDIMKRALQLQHQIMDDSHVSHESLDLEKLGRMEFSDKAAVAADLHLRNVSKRKAFEAEQDAHAKRKAEQAAQDKADREFVRKQRDAQKGGEPPKGSTSKNDEA